jgi:3-oxoacyl-[acyl-carrier protein] reductase
MSAARTAIVTGGGRGIGAARGAALAVVGDVRREEDVARLVAEHERTLGPVDVLVNDAGILVRALAEETSPAAFREVLDVNLTGAFLCARAVIPGMKARRRGRIVNVTSISGTLGTPAASAYNASKWGLVGLTKCLAEELRAHGVQCVSVSPGSVDTEMLRKTPFPPEMTADDVARVVVFAALDAPDAITGSNVEVHG